MEKYLIFPHPYGIIIMENKIAAVFESGNSQTLMQVTEPPAQRTESSAPQVHYILFARVLQGYVPAAHVSVPW